MRPLSTRRIDRLMNRAQEKAASLKTLSERSLGEGAEILADGSQCILCRRTNVVFPRSGIRQVVADNGIDMSEGKQEFGYIA